jgi:hypothetical protein
MHPFFICNQEQVDLKLRTLTKTGVSKEDWGHYYRDEDTKEEWLLTVWELESGGYVSVLKRLPELSIGELIDIALTSADQNDIIGASLELWGREKDNNDEFRQQLMDRLLQIDTSSLDEFEKERLRLIIYESNLYEGTNKRNIVGKHILEIKKDADFYWTIAENARKILDIIGRSGS